MIQGPHISVITPCFNSIHTIRETIESVRAQTYTNWEHIVIDGSSTDGTVELLREYSHLKWISERDDGHYHAMNKGLERATGEIVAILNADDCYLPETLKRVADAFQTHPDWDALFSDIIYVDGRGQEIFRREEAVFDYDVLRYSGVCYVMHPTLFVKKEVHRRLGVYRHEKFLNGCDFDFILRMGRAECRIGHIPVYLVKYRYHEHGQSADMRIARNNLRESLILRKEHGFTGGLRGQILRTYSRLKRQFQKLRYRGKCDLIPGTWILKKHMRAKTSFSSQILDKLNSVDR